MIDLDLIRNNPKLVKDNIKKKFQHDKLPLVDEIVAKDKGWRASKQEADELRAKRNRLSKEINERKKKGEDVSAAINEAKSIPRKIAELEWKIEELKARVKEILLILPNIIHTSVPIGKDHTKNVEVERTGKPRKFTFDVKNHIEIGEALGMLDFDSSAETSGKGFYYLKGDIALLNMALVNFARDYMVKHGYHYLEPPLMIRKNVLTGVYSNQEIEAMSYKIEGEDLYLIATSEHSLIGMFIDKTLKKEDLPIKLTSYSMCFRKEIGSHGIEEKGLYRTHQFNKQEMVVICKPEDSYKFYDELLKLSKELFKNLEIPIRELECCSGDLSDLKAKSADLEAWSPRQKKYFEITSVTNMESAQARRLNIKFTDKKGNKDFVHTLNNTAIATSRALVAIMENYQTKEGEIEIPKVLQKYCGFKKIERNK